MKKVGFYTLGCKVNQYETEAMSKIFENNGYQVVDFEEKADVYVVNTCTVTGVSARKSRQMIRRGNRDKNAILVVVGCYSQEASEEVEKIDGVDIILGTKDRGKILEYIDKVEDENKIINAVEEIKYKKDFEKLEIQNFNERSRAYIKIQDGCNQFCSYCIIPFARGPIRSRDIEEIVTEIINLTKVGFKEFVLTGIHLASYGKENNGPNLVNVLKRVNNIDGVERIRLGSLEPLLINEEFVLQIKEIEKLCPHFHISLQSGSNETLKRMNRKYLTSDFMNSVNMLRSHLNDVAITTDIIVGFPGETEEEFNETFEFLKQVQFASMHVFKYSPRKGTKAYDFKEQITGDVKEVRSKKLIELSQKDNINYNNSHIGKIMNVLYEQEVKGKEGYIEGVTTNYIKVMVKGNIEESKNKILPTKLLSLKGQHIVGEIII
jgi:threonylcarbamoyladenosine tRNA methylthiotransferase MtaB